ncbi:hypothetical protein F8M41_024724 [Gigaspora margarita]|uniref:Uncharacterized protein n=1 Tax=Gigaspora margarita TaxID=4874 RepID=A0A8H4ABJ6_GIGMA|nr:hypothetical protein F8M41_024724 [Gigaspora margarita]
MRNFIFQTPLTPETFQDRSKIKCYKTLKNSQDKFQYIPNNIILNRLGLHEEKTLIGVICKSTTLNPQFNQLGSEEKKTLSNALYKNTIPTSSDLNLYKPYKQSIYIESKDANIVKLELAKLKIANQEITLDYQHKNENKQQYYCSLVWICNETLISHNGYRKFAAINSNIVREYLLEQQHKKINNQMKQYLPIVLFNINQILEFEENITENVAEIDIDLNNSKIENAVYWSIKSLLTVLVLALTTSNIVVLHFGNKINIKIGGDG